eukprot:14104544-Alexandrium_andersonii.AAC.1
MAVCGDAGPLRPGDDDEEASEQFQARLYGALAQVPTLAAPAPAAAAVADAAPAYTELPSEQQFAELLRA